MLKSLFKKRGEALVARGRYERAQRWYRWAGDLEALGDSLMGARAYEKSMRAYMDAECFAKAAEAALKAQLPGQASELFVKSGQIERAAEALASSGNLTGAVQVFLDHGRTLDAAALSERMGRKNQAARLYAQAGAFDRAIALFRETANWEKLALVYKMKGDVAGGIEECRRRNELVAAAILCELEERWSEAAVLYAAWGLKDKAIALFEKAGDWLALAEMYQQMGKLHLAAQAYTHVPGKDLDAAVIFEELVILQKAGEWTLDKDVICGAMSGGSREAALGTMDRAVHLMGGDFKPLWRFSLSGEGLPRATAISADGKTIAVATEGAIGSSDHALIVLNPQKEVLWQKQLPEPVKDMLFLPAGESGVKPTLVAATGDDIVCFGADGAELWKTAAGFKPWSIALSCGGDHLIAATLGGSLIVLDLQGNPLGEAKLNERLHSVCPSPDGVNYIAAAGGDRLLMLTPKFERLWELEKKDAFRRVLPLPGRQVIAAAGVTELSLLNLDGATIFNENFDRRILALFSSTGDNLLFVALEGGGILGFSSSDCRLQAAECYARAGHKKEAADIYQSIERYREAYDLYKEIGDFEAAANTLHLTGDTITAARHYEVVGKFEKAAQLYEEVGETYLAAKCFGKANRPKEAARLYEQLNDVILAADFYERAGCFREAGLLFKKANQIDRAVACFEEYYGQHKGDKEIIFELGVLYKSIEQFDEAIKMFQMLTDDERFKRQALQRLGQCFQSKKLFDVAIDRLMECLGDDKKPSRDNIDIYYDLGCTYEQAGNYDEAKKIFGRVMAIDYYYRDIQQRLHESEQMSVVKTQTPGALNRQTQVIGAESQPDGAVTAKHQRYKIVKKLGEGGMGVVYLATDSILNREVAWKVLPAHLAGNEEFQQRLLREARAAAKLSHKNIVAIYDIVTNPSECFITMEYINGQPLRNILRSRGKLTIEQALRYGRQMAEALEAAHRAGVTHRDVKPENIMISFDDDEVKMVDFGLARLSDDINLTREGCVVGTIPYMAPEQIMAREVGPHTDLYALGVILFEMLAGRTPFVGENILAQHLHNPPPDVRDFCPTAPEPLALLIDDCLEKDFQERPKGCDEVLRRLSAIA
ncbi:MAG: hypothetical protein Kow0059_00280 [Candidatus Sumerlaeia bacterium]